MDDCPVCRKPVLDHAFLELLRCAHAQAKAARVLLRQALTTAEDTVDGATWTRAASTRSAMEAVDQAIAFVEEAVPALAADEEE